MKISVGDLGMTKFNLMLGANGDTVICISYGLMNVGWRRTLGWKRSKPAEAGQSAKADEGDV
jgi:hypothetical protein